MRREKMLKIPILRRSSTQFRSSLIQSHQLISAFSIKEAKKKLVKFAVSQQKNGKLLKVSCLVVINPGILKRGFGCLCFTASFGLCWAGFANNGQLSQISYGR